MKIIGKGYWYNVYDLKNSRVIKLEKGFLQKICDTYQFEGKNITSYLKTIFKLLTGKRKIMDAYAYIQNNSELGLVGFPTFLDGINYEQNKVEILGSVLLGLNLIKRKELIDLYIKNIIECWRNGFADNVYNFTINNGVDSSGKLIFLDFNEITLLKADVLKSIETKRWLRAWSLNQIDIELQQYYREQMNMEVTTESLEQNWQRNKSILTKYGC